MIEQIVVGILANFEWFEGISTFVLGRAASGWMDSGDFSFGAGGIGAVPDPLPAAMVMLGYTVILGGLAFWLFQRKDVAGAKGG